MSDKDVYEVPKPPIFQDFYDYEIWSHGKCCQCGSDLKDNEGLFLCDKCKILNQKYYEEHSK